MRTPSVIVAAALAVFLPQPWPAQEVGRPEIVVLTTGGTIASRIGAPMAEGDSLVEAVPELLG
jgi:L-asparaginase/Glu-tRNA(Gln) amidotransferase subunit D